MIKHKPLNYDSFDLSGSGKNIKYSLTLDEKSIWQKALPFQDKRDDKGHAEMTAYFALKLTALLGGNRAVIIPAAILHDIGWSQLTKPELELFYIIGLERYEPLLRQRHQEQGIKLAKKLLRKLGYPTRWINKICEIVSEHDTRKGFLSLEDGIVRDADKLWRYTLPILRINMEKKGKTLQEYYEAQLRNISKPGFFYSDASREIARIELENTMKVYKSQR